VCRVAQERFPDEPIAAVRSRGFIAAALRRWSLPDLVPDMELAVTELVTNAILHACTPLVVTLCVADGRAEVAVTDHDLRSPRMLPHRSDLAADLDALAEAQDDEDPRHLRMHYGPAGSVTAGRGLIILDAISSAWGVTPRPNGKDVWACMSVPSTWPHLGECVCSTDSSLTTASGLPVRHIAGEWDDG
jgi:Histidine kinase-like ATPase domain